MARKPNGRFAKGTTGNPSGRPRKDSAPAPRTDGWQNVLTGVGNVSLDKRQSTVFYADTVSYAQAADLMRGDDTAARAVEKIIEDSLRPGFDLLVSNMEGAKDLQESIEQRWEDLYVDKALHQAASYERAYGGAAIMIGAQDGHDIRTPLQLERVASVDYLTVLDPREITPLWYYANPFQPNFGMPAIYQVSPIFSGVEESGHTGGATVFEIHESRMAIFGGVQVNRDIRNNGWGDSVLTRLWRVLRDFNTVWDSAGVIAADFAQSIFKIKDLAQIIANDDTDTFKNRLKALELGRSVVRAAVLDSEEEFERKATPLSGFPELLDRFESRVAAACGMPVTVLFGRSPAGLNATGESDLQIWYETLASYRMRKITPALKKITAALLAEAGVSPESWDVKGRPIRESSDKEIAEIRKIHAETDSIAISSGVLFAEEAALSRYGGDSYGSEIVVDFSEREKLEAELEAEQLEADEKALEIAQAQTPKPEDLPAQPPSDAEDPPQGEETAVDDESE